MGIKINICFQSILFQLQVVAYTEKPFDLIEAVYSFYIVKYCSNLSKEYKVGKDFIMCFQVIE